MLFSTYRLMASSNDIATSNSFSTQGFHPDKLLVKPDNQTCSILPPLFLCRQSVYLYSLPSHFPSNWVESVKLNIPGRGIFTKPWVCKTYYFVDCGFLWQIVNVKINPRGNRIFKHFFIYRIWGDSLNTRGLLIRISPVLGKKNLKSLIHNLLRFYSLL